MPPVDLVLENANVITMDPTHPRAGAVAVRDGRIVAVDEEITAPGARSIDCAGGTLAPGFNDAHCHIFSLLRKLISVDLGPLAVRSIADIKQAIAARVAETPPNRWITGTDYNEFYLEEQRHPTRWDIDEVAPAVPVVLSHRSLHVCVLNSRALELAGITRETPEPPGTTIERDITDGEPNGILYEMLGHIRERVMPGWTDDELARATALADELYLSNGITSLQDATVVNDPQRWLRLRRFVDNRMLHPRISMMVGWEAFDQFREAGLAFRDGDDRLRLGAMKVVPSYSAGGLYPPPPELERIVFKAHRDGFQVAIHAVSDSTINAILDAFERAQVRLPRRDSRHRLEHCAECPPDILDRVIETGVVVATQPSFVYYSGERYLATVEGEKLPWLYRIKSLLDNGVTVAASSDSPIVPPSPLVGIQAAVTRRAASGQRLLPTERVTPEQALGLYTTGAAFASFDEDVKGSLTPGKLADIVLLSDDPTAVPPEEIKDIRVLKTIIGGEVVWEAVLVHNDG